MNDILSLRILGFSLIMKSYLKWLQSSHIYRQTKIMFHPLVLRDDHPLILRDKHPSILRDKHHSILQDKHPSILWDKLALYHPLG